MCSTTEVRGFLLSSIPDLTPMSQQVCVLSLDFHTMQRSDVPLEQTFLVKALHDGQIDAAVAYWDIWSDPERCNRLTTNPSDTKGKPWSYARNMHWGQGLQMVEDHDIAERGHADTLPMPLQVVQGEELQLTVRFSKPQRNTFQVMLRRTGSNH